MACVGNTICHRWIRMVDGLILIQPLATSSCLTKIPWLSSICLWCQPQSSTMQKCRHLVFLEVPCLRVERRILLLDLGSPISWAGKLLYGVVMVSTLVNSSTPCRILWRMAVCLVPAPGVY